MYSRMLSTVHEVLKEGKFEDCCGDYAHLSAILAAFFRLLATRFGPPCQNVLKQASVGADLSAFAQDELWTGPGKRGGSLLGWINLCPIELDKPSSSMIDSVRVG